MIDRLFLSVLNMSITASCVILVVLLVRPFLKKVPKIFSYVLWAVVLFRLICPFSFESAISVLPINATPIPQDIMYSTEPQIDTGFNIVDNVVNPMLPIPNNAEDSANPLQIWVFVGSVIWGIGILAMLIYSIIQLVRIRQKLVGATPLRDNIYLADHISSPFVIGFIKPHIYLPSSLNEAEQEFIIAHEQYHIKRFDHIARILGFIALTIHWFNPLVWLTFALSGKDMEMSCDEAVMKKIGTDIRTEYSQSLLRFATDKKLITATPLAFGEGDTKDRVKNVMKYKKATLWVVVVSTIVIVAATIFLLANPLTKDTGNLAGFTPYDTFAFSELESGENQFYKDDFTISSDDSELNYVVTWTRSGYVLDVGLISHDGTEYLVEATGGSSKGTIKDIPSGTYQVVVKSNKSNAKYKTTTDNSVAVNGSFAFSFSGEVLAVKDSDDIPNQLTHDQAVALALTSIGNQYLNGECFSEGHIILGYDDSDETKTKIYALTTIGWYGFENNNFAEVSGAAFPAVITLFSDNHVEIEKPLDGSDYAKSIEKMFPKEYHDRIFNYGDAERDNLKQQREKYASEYLSKIGRDAKIGDHSDFDYTSLTDEGVSVEASNNLENFYKAHSYYPSFIGTRERLENGVRMVYEMSYQKNQDEIKFAKYNYDTKETIEQFIVSATFGGAK